jgi:hypothetical protein
MTGFSIHSRKHGEVRFVVLSAGGYVRVYGNGWDGRQPCDSGRLMGSTLIADEASLESVARRWWVAFLAGQREFSL